MDWIELDVRCEHPDWIGFNWIHKLMGWVGLDWVSKDAAMSSCVMAALI